MVDNGTQVARLLAQWQQSIIHALPDIASAVLILLLFTVLAWLFRRASLRFYNRVFPGNPRAGQIIGMVAYGFFMLSGIFLALEVLDLAQFLTHLLAGAGIVGIIAGFAFKDIASNAFAGLLIKSQRPFDVGDWVGINGIYGVVETVGMVTTAVNTVKGQRVFVPNQLVYNNTFTNYSALGKQRVILQSGVSYGDDLAHVRTVALDEIGKIPMRLPDEEVDFYFTEISSSTYNFEVRFWIRFSQNKDSLEAMSEAVMQLKKRFEAENISIAYNVTTLDFGVKGGVNLFDKPLKINRLPENAHL